MKIEDRLSDAMHDYADAIEPAEGSWDQISSRFDGGAPPRRPARGRLVLAGVAITLVIVLIAVLAIRDDGATNKVATHPDGAATPPPTAALSSERPAGVLAETTSGEVVSMDGGTGQVHEFFDSFPAYRSIGPIAPDGLSFVYSKADRSEGCTAESQAEIGKRGLIMGAERRIVSGAVAPVVSPDGRFVAYGIVCDGVTLGFSDLRDGKNYRINPFPENVELRQVQRVEPVAWALDSQRLLYRIVTAGPPGSEPQPMYYLGQLWPSADGSAVTATATRPSMTAAAFVDAQTLAIAQDIGTGSTVSFLDGFLDRTTPQCLSTACGIRAAFGVADRITELVAAPGGHLLAVTEGHVLYRWSVGDAAPTKLADDVVSAGWIPWS